VEEGKGFEAKGRLDRVKKTQKKKTQKKMVAAAREARSQ
jgi:hypothetical protein